MKWLPQDLPADRIREANIIGPGLKSSGQWVNFDEPGEKFVRRVARDEPSLLLPSLPSRENAGNVDRQSRQQRRFQAAGVDHLRMRDVLLPLKP